MSLCDFTVVGPAFSSQHSLEGKIVRRDQLQGRKPIVWKKRAEQLPRRVIVPMTRDVLAADTGPEGGVQCLAVEQKKCFDPFHGSQRVSGEPIAGVRDWSQHHHKAFGLSQSLYDFDLENNTPVGEPNADAFAVVARENNAFFAVADGCGWGEKSFIAARSAVKGCIEYLSDHLHKATTTQEITDILLRSFQHAHRCIVHSEGTVTTLCAAVVCKVQRMSSYGLCVVNVGDSLAFVYRKNGCVQEVTVGSHDAGVRDMQQTGGCLGPLVGDDPDLGNLTCSFTFVDDGDIVFLTSDGITDNFDPKVLMVESRKDLDNLLNPRKLSRSQDSVFEHPVEREKTNQSNNSPARYRSYSAPMARESVNPRDFSCALMKEVIQSESPSGEESSAKELCAKLINFAVQKTRTKRRFMEQNRHGRREEIEKKKKLIPGKLDHATVVAFEVGRFERKPLKLKFHDKRPKLRNEVSRDDEQMNGKLTKKSVSDEEGSPIRGKDFSYILRV